MLRKQIIRDQNWFRAECELPQDNRFEGGPLNEPHYAEAVFMKTIFLLFSHMNFTHVKILHAFSLP